MQWELRAASALLGGCPEGNTDTSLLFTVGTHLNLFNCTDRFRVKSHFQNTFGPTVPAQVILQSGASVLLLPALTLKSVKLVKKQQFPSVDFGHL